ncbi:MAG: DNA recombination protein RmuC, partial [Candidatus Heimdallarchaeaceae archaeon]
LPLSMEEPENILFDEREITRLNKEVVARAKEIERYSEPAITTDFVLMYIPDFVYGLLRKETYQELIDMNVIPTNTSGLLSTIFMINMQHRFIRLNSSAKQFGSFQVQVSQGIRRIIENMGKGEKQISYCLNNIVAAMGELERLRENIENIELQYDEDNN